MTYPQVHGSPVLKVSSEFLRQDLQSSYSFANSQNVGETELSEEKILCFIGESFMYRFHILRKEEDVRQLYLVLKLSCRRTGNLLTLLC